MGDIFDKTRQYTVAREAMKKGYYPYFLPMTNNEGTESVFNGQHVIMCGSNNYLGLTTHPEVKKAAIDAIKTQGTSCTGSRFLNGNLELHQQLEEELAEWVGKEAALVFSTGMQVNLGVISSIVDHNEYLILDKEAHASIVDGALLSRAKVKRFRHNDLNDLERILSRLPENAGSLVIVDGLYSMGGDLAPLPDIVSLCKKYGSRIMVDDAHGMGVMGSGRGTVFHFGLTEKVDLIMSTFSKSFASLGGFIAGDEQVIHYIKHHARSLIFSAAITPSNAAAALASLHVLKKDKQLGNKALRNGKKVREGLKKMGYNTGCSESPIVPVIIGDDMKTIAAWWSVLNNGIYVNAILSPAVPKGQQLLRTSYMATHSDEQLEKVLEAFYQTGKELDLI